MKPHSKQHSKQHIQTTLEIIIYLFVNCWVGFQFLLNVSLVLHTKIIIYQSTIISVTWTRIKKIKNNNTPMYRLCAVTHDPRESTFSFQKAPVCIPRANVIAFHGSFGDFLSPGSEAHSVNYEPKKQFLWLICGQVQWLCNNFWIPKNEEIFAKIAWVYYNA